MGCGSSKQNDPDYTMSRVAGTAGSSGQQQQRSAPNPVNAMMQPGGGQWYAANRIGGAGGRF